MGDPFLHRHQHSTRVFTLANRTPLSVRDQLIRAHYLCDRLLTPSFLGGNTSMLVVGAGAAGSTIAVLAARAGLKTVLIDSSRSPFKLQRSCSSRWLDPVQYDWPHDHAYAGQWPVSGLSHAVPFGFKAERASVIAGTWASTLNIERAQWNLQAEFNTKLIKMPVLGAGSSVVSVQTENVSKGMRQTRDFHVVVLAVGMSNERTQVPQKASSPRGGQFKGMPFWEKDDFEQPQFGLTRPGRVLISGAGDGGLQDFVRLTTGAHSALGLLESLFLAAGISRRQQRGFLKSVEEAEHHVERSLPWSGSRLHDHRLLSEVHARHQAWLQQFELHFPRDWSAMMGVLDAMSVGRRSSDVLLIHACNHFDACYPLNRFVALLVDKWLKDRYGSSAGVLPQFKLIAARPDSSVAGHPCSAKQACWDECHEVDLVNEPLCYQLAAGTPISFKTAGLIVRHGIKKHTSARWQRQLLPHHLL